MASRIKKEHAVVHKTAPVKSSQLPSIVQLIQDSWDLFNITALSYLKLLGLTIAFLFIGAIIGILIAVPLSFTAFFAHHHNLAHLSTFPVIMLFLFIFWAVLYILSVIIISFVFPVTSILILQHKKVPSVLEVIGQSKKYVLPYFLAIVLTALTAFGGIILFVIPGLLIGLFFVFVAYEIVLDGQSSKKALARSYIMVKNHFWEVLIRLVVLEVGLFIISSILTHIDRSSWLLIIVHLLFSLFSVWYSRAYTYLLYKQIHERTTFPQNISLQWIWVVSWIGWVFLALLFIGLWYGSEHNPWLQTHHHVPYRYITPRKPI